MARGDGNHPQVRSRLVKEEVRARVNAPKTAYERKCPEGEVRCYGGEVSCRNGGHRKRGETLKTE